MKLSSCLFKSKNILKCNHALYHVIGTTGYYSVWEGFSFGNTYVIDFMSIVF